MDQSDLVEKIESYKKIIINRKTFYDQIYDILLAPISKQQLIEIIVNYNLDRMMSPQEIKRLKTMAFVQACDFNSHQLRSRVSWQCNKQEELKGLEAGYFALVSDIYAYFKYVNEEIDKQNFDDIIERKVSLRYALSIFRLIVPGYKSELSATLKTDEDFINCEVGRYESHEDCKTFNDLVDYYIKEKYVELSPEWLSDVVTTLEAFVRLVVYMGSYTRY